MPWLSNTSSFVEARGKGDVERIFRQKSVKVYALGTTGPVNERHIPIELFSVKMRDRTRVDEYRLFAFQSGKLYRPIEIEIDFIGMLNSENRNVVTLVSKVLQNSVPTVRHILYKIAGTNTRACGQEKVANDNDQTAATNTLRKAM